MPNCEQQDEFLGALEALGGQAGNGKLRELLGWDEAVYEAVKAELVGKGSVVPGRGRGGSVAIASMGAERGELPSSGGPPTKSLRPVVSAPPLGSQPTGKQSLSAFIWSVADLLRGNYKQSDYGKVILPFTVLRRLDCVLEPTKAAVLEEKPLREGQGLDPEPFLLRKAGQNFCNTSPLDMKRLMGDQDNISENLWAYIQAFTPAVRDIFECFEFHLQVDRLKKAGLLYLVSEKFAQIDLHPDKVSNAEMGLVFEELIRKFAELSNETAGEHFTRRDVIRLMVNLLFIEDEGALSKPGVVRTLYDPAVGTGGMLSVSEEHLAEHNPQARLVMYGQELNAESYAICKADMLIKGQDIRNIIFGNTLNDDGLQEQQFDYMLSNPPLGVDWKKIEKDIRKEAELLGYKGRFGPGLPRVSDGSLLFLLHLISKMRPAVDGGSRIGIVLIGTPLLGGGAGSGESEIRRYLLENDLVEAIVALPKDMFYNTGISTYIWILSNRKSAARMGKVQLIDASSFWQKMHKNLGRKRKDLSSEHIEEITQIFARFEETEKDGKPISKIFANEAFGYRTITVERPLRDEAGNVVVGQKGKPVADSSLRDTENVPLSEDVQTYFKREVLPHVPDAWIDINKTKVGYEVPFKQLFARDFVTRQIARLESQYKSFSHSKIGEIAQSVGIHRVCTSDKQAYCNPNQTSDNCLHIRCRRSGGIETSTAPFMTPLRGDILFEVHLGNEASSAYIDLFFKSPLGRLSLEMICPKIEAVVMQPSPRWQDIRKIPIPLPDPMQQLQIIETLQKLENLKLAIESFEVGLSMNPTGSSSASKRLDAMLQMLDKLSDADKIRGMTREGETKSIEFKQTLSLDIKKSTKEKYIEESALKTVVAFMNTDGGTLLIGIADSGEIIGIEAEVGKLFRSRDDLLLHWKNLVKGRIGEQFYPFIDSNVVTVDSAQVLVVSCKNSPTPCYLDGRDFYVRTNPATDKLEGPKLVEYVQNHFQ